MNSHKFTTALGKGKVHDPANHELAEFVEAWHLAIAIRIVVLTMYLTGKDRTGGNAILDK